MEKFVIVGLVLAWFLSSGFVGLMVFNYLERRDQNIRDRIEELESEEEYLTRIHNDEKKLNRSTFTVILMALCIAFASMAILTGTIAFDPPQQIRKYIYLGSAWMFMVSAGMCYYHFRSIMRIGNLDRTREQFRQRKMRLEDRLR